MNIIKVIHYESGNYLWSSGQVKNNTKYKIQSTPIGVLLHTTGANNPTLKRYVQPSKSDPNYQNLINLIGLNKNGNSWNRPTLKKEVHYMIGKLADGTVACAQMLPDNYACWGCGAGKKGSYNYYPTQYIQFEICEDGCTNKDYFLATKNMAVEFCVSLCKKYGWDATHITSHNEARLAGYASSHVDPTNWWNNFNYTMADFRKEVQEKLDELNKPVVDVSTVKVGDTVMFIGNKQWTNSQKADTTYAQAKPGLATVQQIYNIDTAKHPFRLTPANSAGKAVVNGWVDKTDIVPLVPDESDKPYAPTAVGETVKFVGTKQWSNANKAEDKFVKATPCNAVVKKIYYPNKSKHPYQLKGPGVNGFVNADDIRKA